MLTYMGVLWGLGNLVLPAYVGPGAGLSAIGAVLALFFALLVAVFGFVWYPIRRLRNACRFGKSDKVDSP